MRQSLGTRGIALNKADRSLCPKQLAVSWRDSQTTYIVLDREGARKGKKESGMGST